MRLGKGKVRKVWKNDKWKIVKYKYILQYSDYYPSLNYKS